MLTMQEINSMIKDNFQNQLQDIKSLPEDLARGYKIWVRGLVKAAAQKMQQEQRGGAEQPQEEMQQGA